MRKITTRLIPGMQVAGALDALFVVVLALQSGVTIGLLAVVLVIICIFGFGVFGAIRLWRDDESGRRYSLLHQALILPKLAISGLVIYDMNDIAYFTIGVTNARDTIAFGFNFGVTLNELQFRVLAQSDITYFGVNLVTVAAIYCLVVWPRWKERNERVNPNIFN